ncbi:hypothetical protein M5K25_013439 [Dendrobium thyrsiflorum]|uniref:Uncharacterized protein n=1 Tax=Dendrobium thyrsiflorum TaxID=117978 RepID=A0ABD0UZU5_DENTH
MLATELWSMDSKSSSSSEAAARKALFRKRESTSGRGLAASKLNKGIILMNSKFLNIVRRISIEMLMLDGVGIDVDMTSVIIAYKLAEYKYNGCSINLHSAKTLNEALCKALKFEKCTSELVTAAQLEGLINEKIKAIMTIEQTKRLVGKGRLYPTEYNQVSYPKGYFVLKFNTFNGTNNPKQHLAQFKVTYGNTGGVDILLFPQFISNLTATAFEWYVELPNDYVISHPTEDCYVFKNKLKKI